MNEARFWELIDAHRDRVDELRDALAALPEADIVAFEKHFATFFQSSYRGELWGAAYLANGGCSDDGFDYFRGWLISRGRKIFEEVVATPDALIDHVGEGEVELEGILYVASKAWRKKTGQDDFFEHIEAAEDTESPDLDLSWSEDGDGIPAELEKRYPRLYAKFG